MVRAKAGELDYFLAWIVFFVATTVLGIIVGAIMGLVIGGMMGAAGMSIGSIQLVCGVLGFLIGIPISYGGFRLVLGFVFLPRLRVVEEAAPDASDPLSSYRGE